MIDRLYAAECYAKNVNVEFYINDIPISIRGPGFGSFWGAPINQYLVNKQNIVSMVIKPGDIPSRAKIGPVTGKYLASHNEGEEALIRICSYPKGALLGGPEALEIARISWPEKRTIKSKIDLDDYKLNSYPLTKEERFKIGKIFSATRSYAKAATIKKLTESLTLSLSEFLQELYECIQQADDQKFIKLTSHRILDNTHSYGKDIKECMKQVESGFKLNLSLQDWALAPLDTENYDFRLCANGKIIHCVSRDWKPIIREKPLEDKSQSFYDIFVSLIKRQWQVVL